MSFAEDMGYDVYDENDFRRARIGEIKVVENNKVVTKRYCLLCNGLNIKISKKGNEYCADICWENKNNL